MEDMAGFFDRRAEEYEAHMAEAPDFEMFYALAVSPIPATEEPLRVLDLGCGTGLELKRLFLRAPNARVTCLDLSAAMLERLCRNYMDKSAQLEIVQASYLDWDYPAGAFDFALSVQTMHHFFPDTKLRVYRKILSSLRPGGAYIEADYMTDAATMERKLAEYNSAMQDSQGRDGDYHFDIPFTPEVQRRLLLEAGFARVDTVYENIRQEWSEGILAARSAGEFLGGE